VQDPIYVGEYCSGLHLDNMMACATVRNKQTSAVVTQSRNVWTKQHG
jgi:hypothetical protein